MVSLKVYVLPDSYEVKDTSFNDIKYAIKPEYTLETIREIDDPDSTCTDLSGKQYIPGYIGMNNLKATDYINVVLHAIFHVKPLRDAFLLTDFDSNKYSDLIRQAGLFTRKLWNTKAFKSQLSPHELVQQISTDSQKRFSPSKQCDAVDFMTWFLNNIHLGLGGTKKKNSSIIYKLFQGQVKVESQTFDVEPLKVKGRNVFNPATDITSQTSPFLQLVLDLPTLPLFQDEFERNIIPQVQIEELLKKYDGNTGTETGNTLRKYTILSLPRYLILHYKRFQKNAFKQEKNNTLVNFPLLGLDLKDSIHSIHILTHSRSRRIIQYKIQPRREYNTSRGTNRKIHHPSAT
jgi:U4/U6.U5 tri-snRNP-associated protein 2